MTNRRIAGLAGAWLLLSVCAAACTPAASSSSHDVVDSATSPTAGRTGTAGASAGRMGSAGKAGSPGTMSGADSGVTPSPDVAQMETDTATPIVPDAGNADDGGVAGEIPVLPGTVLLLDATKGVTEVDGKVSVWADQSGMKNDAKNGNAKFQPTLVMRTAGPAIHFSGKQPDNASNGDGHGGTFLRVLDKASVQFGKSDWIILAVMSYTNKIDASHNGVLGAIFGKYASNGEILFTGNWTYSENPNREQGCIHLGFGESASANIETAIGGYNNGNTSKYLNDGKVRIITARRMGSRAAVRINGKQELADGSFGANSDLSFPGTHIGIGSFSASSDTSADRSLQGDIYYLVAVKAASIADKDVEALEAALTRRFNPAPIP